MTISASYQAAKNLHRPLTETDDLDETLAWRERMVTRNLTLRYDRMMLLLDPTRARARRKEGPGASG